MIGNETQIKSGITIGVSVIVKILRNIMCAKKFIFGILIQVDAKMVNL